MTFHIDTGAPDSLPASAFASDWLRDTLTEHASDASIASATAYALIGELRGYRSAQWMRRKLLENWQFLQALSAEDPATFDAVLSEYAERLTEIS